MTPTLSALLVYSAQVTMVVAAATIAASVVRLPNPHVRLWYWRAVAILCLALPLLSVGALRDHPTVSVTFGPAPDAGVVAAGRPALLSGLGSAVLWVVGAGMIARLIWLLLGARRLRQLRVLSAPATVNEEIDALRSELAPRAQLRWTDVLRQPVAFGVRRPVVLLPRRFADLSLDGQRGVACHELAHIARGDWVWLVAEEQARALFWFHPAVWWVLDRIYLSREQVVDQFVVSRTGSRQAYMEALLAFAEAGRAEAPAMAFLRRRHVGARLLQLSKEGHMSRQRLAGALCVLFLALAGSTRMVVSALPLTLPALAAQGAPTRLEVRLAELARGAGLVEATVVGSGERVYLRPEVLATGPDVLRARVSEAGISGYSIAVEFTTTAASRLTASTAAHVGKPLAILIDGRVIAAPLLRSAIGQRMVMSGSFTKAEADTIAAGLAPTTNAPARLEQAGTAGATQAPVSLDDPGVVAPVVVSKAKVTYTRAAMAAKIQGVVELSAVVSAAGVIGDVVVTQSLDAEYGLDQSAIDSVKQWRFTPGTKDGTPVPVRVSISVRFTLA